MQKIFLLSQKNLKTFVTFKCHVVSSMGKILFKFETGYRFHPSRVNVFVNHFGNVLPIYFNLSCLCLHVFTRTRVGGLRRLQIRGAQKLPRRRHFEVVAVMILVETEKI